MLAARVLAYREALLIRRRTEDRRRDAPGAALHPASFSFEFGRPVVRSTRARPARDGDDG